VTPSVADAADIAEHLDEYLELEEYEDFSGAYNGLQVATRAPVERVAAAVDACQETIDAAVEADADLLLVHHGLFWGKPLPIRGRSYRRLSALFEAELGVYAAHLPLDGHAEVGNNVLLASALDLPVEGRWGTEKGNEGLGVWSAADLPREELAERVARACGREPRVIPGGPSHVRRVGIVTGGAGSMIPQAAGEGLDTFITGEGAHHTYHLATELGVNVIYAGHYATETFGVKAVAEHVADRFGVDWTYLENPTGL